MQCSSCRAVYSNGLDICPRCKTAASKAPPEIISEPTITAEETVASAPQPAAEAEEAAAPKAAAAQAGSTLIEFPGVSRGSRPQWRKELSERVREIQERRARDASQESEPPLRGPAGPQVAEAVAPQLGLVPQPDAPAMNPIVAAALKRIERARQPTQPMPRARASMGGAAAAAVARVAEDQYQPETKQIVSQAPVAAPVPVLPPATPAEDEKAIQTKAPEAARERPLVVVPAQPAKKAPVVESKPQTRRAEVAEATVEAAVSADDELLRADSEEELYDDRAPVGARLAGSVIDLLVVAFASSPFAAIIELTNGNWADWRVVASMGGIVFVVMFLYLTTATALAGRTWGMSLVSLGAVDAETGLPPTTKQAVARALFYMLSLLTLGLGLIYALFDAEGRTAHDHFSGTIVVRD